jgi:hypothetical protein
MAMAGSISTYIDDLFKYIDTYENNYAAFKTEAFFQTYNGIYSLFQALRQERQKAVEVDQYFLHKIKSGPLNSSDLKQMALQVMITFFESVADTDGQTNRAYLYCRDLRPVRRDVSYFEEHLVPLLHRPGSFNNNFDLNAFFLHEIGRFIQKFGQGVRNDLTPEQFDAMPDHGKLLELSRRRHELGEDLLRDRNSLEFHLHQVGTLDKLSQASPVFNQYLETWGYLTRVGFWDKVKSAGNVLWGKFKSLFSSFGYFRLSLSQRNPAYIFYGIIIIVFIWLAIYVPLRWNRYTEDKLIDFENRVEQTQEAISK